MSTPRTYGQQHDELRARVASARRVKLSDLQNQLGDVSGVEEERVKEREGGSERDVIGKSERGRERKGRERGGLNCPTFKISWATLVGNMDIEKEREKEKDILVETYSERYRERVIESDMGGVREGERERGMGKREGGIGEES